MLKSLPDKNRSNDTMKEQWMYLQRGHDWSDLDVKWLECSRHAKANWSAIESRSAGQVWPIANTENVYRPARPDAPSPSHARIADRQTGGCRTTVALIDRIEKTRMKKMHKVRLKMMYDAVKGEHRETRCAKRYQSVYQRDIEARAKWTDWRDSDCGQDPSRQQWPTYAKADRNGNKKQKSRPSDHAGKYECQRLSAELLTCSGTKIESDEVRRRLRCKTCSQQKALPKAGKRRSLRNFAFRKEKVDRLKVMVTRINQK